MRVKWITTLDGWKVRVVRILWADDTRFLSIGLAPKLAGWKSIPGEWRATLLGVTLHYRRSWGGRFA
jgi:hypothetical protein